jgi:hypothetical protein
VPHQGMTLSTSQQVGLAAAHCMLQNRCRLLGSVRCFCTMLLDALRISRSMGLSCK